MSALVTMDVVLDPDEKWLYRVGGISAWILVIAYLLTFPIYARVGDAPASGVETRLVYFAHHAAGWWAILGLMVVTDLLYVPIFLSLYQALKEVGKNSMRLAAACIGLFVILDLVLTWTAFAVLIAGGGKYAASTTDVQKTAILATAAYASAILHSPLLGIYAIFIPSLGILLAGRVMLKGVFNQATAHIALAVGVTGILFMGSYFVSALGIFRIINALLVTIWHLFVGFRLCRLGRQ